MPLQSSGIIVVDKTSVITTASTSVGASTPGSGRTNGIFGNIGGGSSGIVRSFTTNRIEPGGGVVLQDWQAGEIEYTSVHVASAQHNPHNLIRRNQRSITVPVSVNSNLQHQTTSKTASISTVPVSNASQFNSNQMSQISHQQQQQLHHQVQHSRQQQQSQSGLHHQTTVLQRAQPSQVIVSEDFLEHATFSSSSNAAGSTNVINLTANDLVNSTQIIKLVSDGGGGNVLIDSLGNVANGGHIHANSKLLVGNLTVLSKQPSSSGSHPTFNFVNAKGISYLTSAKSQPPQAQATQQQIHHIAAAGNNASNAVSSPTALVQKMGVPRNVQVVTRVQAINPASPQPQGAQISQGSQASTHGTQVIMQQKYMQNLVNGAAGAGSVSTKVNSGSGSLKKQTSNINKLGQSKATIASGQKNNFHQQHLQHQTMHLPAFQQQQPLQSIGIQQSTHATIKPVRSSQKIVRKIVGSGGKSSVGATNAKYIMQSPLVLTSANNNQLMSTKVNNNSTAPGNMVSQQMLSGLNNSGCSTSGGGAIKFVNAHGAVIQSHHSQSGMQSSVQAHTQAHTTPQQGQKVRSQLNKSQNNQNQHPMHQQPHQFSQATTAVVTNEGILIPAYVNSSQNSSNGDEIMINGTQMTEEMSARILQSLSQKSIYNSIRQYQQHPPQQQQQKILQQQQPSPQAAGLVFETSAGISAREYAFCKQQPSHSTAQQVQGGGGLHQPKVITTSNVVFEQNSNREYGVCKTTTIQSHHPQQHQQKIIQQSVSQGPSLSVPSSSTNVVYETQSSRLYAQHHQQQQHTIQNQQQRAGHQQIHLQHQLRQQQQQQQYSQSLSQRRAQSLDRKYGGNHGSKRSTDYFKVNTNEILSSYSSPTTFIDNIPLPYPIQRDDNAPATQPSEHEDDYMGVEVRPTPVSTDDEIVKALHAILQDHTYVAAMPIGLPLELYQQQQQQQQQHSYHQQPSHQFSASGASQQSQQPPGLPFPLQQQQTHIGGITSNAVTSVATSCVSGSSGTVQLTTTTSAMLTSGNLAVYPYINTAHHQVQRDDDAHSVISNESRQGHDGIENDLGEETETAPEAEAEDDSVTRCICDLTHDDGYMICCDKCSAWQHVECMGIDSSNIPDEYLCEVCQPRHVDRARAKTLQLLKRKEQTQLLLNAQMNSVNNISDTLIPGSTGQSTLPGNTGHDRLQPLVVNTGASTLNNVSGKKSKLVGGKKKEILKRVKKERSNGKRRESKRTTKRKTKTAANSNEMNSSEKQAHNLRQYIENYESAMTNHYSPELRARLLSVAKQMPSFTEQKIARSLHCADKCTTVPHAGGKILISNLDIQPKSPIIELRGKYMLATQYKNQNPSINMNHHTNNALQKNLKIPGPFIFFHRLSPDPGVPEICVDTRTYGNEARFVRRSCRPNAEVQHSFEKGTIHLWIVSLTNIMASTEITIRHEPHDLTALESRQPAFSISPTSTMCACGLTKDCPFATSAPSAIGGGAMKSTNKKVVVNGTSVSDGKHPQPPAAQANDTSASLVKKSTQNISRGRSTSSSGESNTGLLSPNSNFTNVYNITSVSVLHDSGVYTSSSSPSVSIPSPTHPQTINSPPQNSSINTNQKATLLQSTTEQFETAPPVTSVESSEITEVCAITKSPQKCNAPIRKTPVKHARNSSTSEDSSSQTAPAVTSQSPPAQEEKRESRKLTREERKMEAIVRAIEKMEKNQQRKQELKQARNSSMAIGKRRNSSSPSPKRVKSQSLGEGIDSVPLTTQASGQQQSMQSARKSSSGTLSRKKKRKSSKSYQMQSSQRKRRHSRVNSNDSDMITSEESSSLLSPPLARTISMPACLPTHGEIAERQKCLLTNLSLDGTQMPDAIAEHLPSQSVEREDVQLPPLQPLQTVQPLSSVPPPLHPIQRPISPQRTMQPSFCEPQHLNVQRNQNTGMLLAFANPKQTSDALGKSQEADLCRSPVRIHNQTEEPGTPQTPPIVSSTCMLVEAAVGPLESLEMLRVSENEFKLPARTKTKKSIMNDWLNQSSDYHDYHQQTSVCTVKEEEAQQRLVEEYQQAPPTPLVQAFEPHNMLLQANLELSQVGKSVDAMFPEADSICEYRQTASSPMAVLAGQTTDEPENLSMMAKKVEEFIHQNDANFTVTEEIKTEPFTVDVNTNLMLPLHVNNCSGSSSVKKRWLRQAISEECSDELANVSAASSPTQMFPTPNGFTTPLKKRRLARECSEIDPAANSPEDLSMSKISKECNLSLGDIASRKIEISNSEEVVSDNKVRIKQEMCEVDDEVDILNSPSPDEKMVVSDDNRVKIEPEDVSTEIKVDVEKEETSSEVKKSETSEQVVPMDMVEKVKLESPYNMDEHSLSDRNLKQAESLLLKAEMSVKEDSCAAAAVVKTETVGKQEDCESISDEIADIQKRLHSFHAENIMILQSRNKSKIARSLKQDPASKGEKKVAVRLPTDVKTWPGSPTKSSTLEAKNKRKVEKPKANVNEKQKKEVNKLEVKNNKVPKKRKVVDVKQKEEAKTKSYKRKGGPQAKIENVTTQPEGAHTELPEKTDANQIVEKIDVGSDKVEASPIITTNPSSEEQLKIDDKHMQAALTIPNFNRALPNASIANYVLNSVEQSYDISVLLSAPPPPPPPLSGAESAIISATNVTCPITQGASQPPPLHLPYYYNTIYGKPLSSVSSAGGSLSSLSPSTLLADYMDSTKTKSLSTLGYISSFGLGLNKSTVGNSSVSTSVSTSSVSAVDSTPTTIASTGNGCSSKILTKTASHDPRLNPILTAPEPPPAPRRKLSINEYRKRKQLSYEPGSGPCGNGLEKQMANLNSQGSYSSGNSSFENGDRFDSASNSNDGSYSEKMTDVNKVQFSPAPTLLEQQQEIICERLRSLKSKSGLGSSSTLGGLQIDGALTSILLAPGTGAPTTGANSLSESNCFNLGKIIDRNDEFGLARRTLRNNSTSSLESISSSSSRRSSYRGTTPVPQQYDGMDSPHRGHGDEIGHSITAAENLETNITENTDTCVDSPATAPGTNHTLSSTISQSAIEETVRSCRDSSDDSK